MKIHTTPIGSSPMPSKRHHPFVRRCLQNANIPSFAAAPKTPKLIRKYSIKFYKECRQR
jgi:hypothetical protein